MTEPNTESPRNQPEAEVNASDIVRSVQSSKEADPAADKPAKPKGRTPARKAEKTDSSAKNEKLRPYPRIERQIINEWDPLDKKVFWDWLREGSQDLWRELAEEIPDGEQVIEIGVLHGASIAFFLEECYRRGKDMVFVTGVDHFDNNRIEQKYRNLPDWIPYSVGHTGWLLRTGGWYRNCWLVKGNSADKHQTFWNNFYYAVSVDGGHDYESVRADLYNYWPKVKQGGLLMGDDYDTNPAYGVKRAVNEFCEDLGLTPRIHKGCYVIRKK